MPEKRESFWDRIFSLTHNSEREELVLEYIIPRRDSPGTIRSPQGFSRGDRRYPGQSKTRRGRPQEDGRRLRRVEPGFEGAERTRVTAPRVYHPGAV
jgi:hypothetical protein